jgi:hypothetical protein
VATVGYDLSEQDVEGQARVASFRKGLQELGWQEGRNVKFDIRWTAATRASARYWVVSQFELGSTRKHKSSEFQTETLPGIGPQNSKNITEIACSIQRPTPKADPAPADAT